MAVEPEPKQFPMAEAESKNFWMVVAESGIWIAVPYVAFDRRSSYQNVCKAHSRFQNVREKLVIP